MSVCGWWFPHGRHSMPWPAIECEGVSGADHDLQRVDEAPPSAEEAPPSAEEAPPSADEAPPSADAMATAVARAIVAAAVFIEHDSDIVSTMTRTAMAKLGQACEAVAPGEIERMRKVVSK